MLKAEALVERIYSYCEAGEVDKATFACLRLARAVGDALSIVLFLRELYPDRRQLRSAFYEETQHLKESAQKFVWENTLEHWLEERTLEFSLDPDDADKNVFVMGVGELRHEVEQLERSIEDLRPPPGMGEYDTAVFTDQHEHRKSMLRLKIRACTVVMERVRTRCLYYALRVESQLAAREKTSDLVSSIQNDVHNYYATRCEPAYQSIRKAVELLGSTDPEDHALLLTSVRRAVKSVADYHYPPVAGAVICADGQHRQLGEDQYLNRLEEFCRTQFGDHSASKLLRAELDYLTVFIRRINDVASKGVHGEVTFIEARQGVLGLYLFLSNLIVKLENARS